MLFLVIFTLYRCFFLSDNGGENIILLLCPWLNFPSFPRGRLLYSNNCVNVDYWRKNSFVGPEVLNYCHFVRSFVGLLFFFFFLNNKSRKLKAEKVYCNLNSNKDWIKVFRSKNESLFLFQESVVHCTLK